MKIKNFLTISSAFLLIGCGGGSNNQNNQKQVTAYFGDKENNIIDIVDISNMRLEDQISTGHKKTYAAEVIKTHGQKHNKTPKMYVDNRGSNVIDVLDSASNTITKTIGLPFYPRSINVNEYEGETNGFVEVSSVNKPMAAIIDPSRDSVIATVGEDTVTYPTTSGHNYVSSGTLACGHPEWLDANHFVLIDRQNKLIKTYKIERDNEGSWKTSLVNSVQTQSPVHNLIPPKVHGKHHHNGNNNTIFFATEEGADGVYPAVLQLDYNPSTGLTISDRLELKIDGVDVNTMGVHHLNFLTDQTHIYIGSDEGHLFIVNYKTSPMSVVKIVDAGKGAGHTDEFKHNNIAVVINHKDKFITVMDTSNNSKIADIEVSNIDDSLVGKVQTQSHPQYHFSKDGRYFYLFLTEEGALVKVDLQEKKVIDRLDIGGKIAMGSFLESH